MLDQDGLISYRKVSNIVCEGCGNRMNPKRPWQRFCNAKCRCKYHNYNRSKRRRSKLNEEAASSVQKEPKDSA